MDKPPAAKNHRRPSSVVDRKLAELDGRLAAAFSCRPPAGDDDFDEFLDIRSGLDFLRTLLAAEKETAHSGGRAPEDYLTDAEARLAALDDAFDSWVLGDVPSLPDHPEVDEAEEEEDEAVSDVDTKSVCSCTDACFGHECGHQEEMDVEKEEEKEGVEATREHLVPAGTEVVETEKEGVMDEKWRRRRRVGGGVRSCFAGIAVVVVVVAIGVAMEFTWVGETVYLVPT